MKTLSRAAETELWFKFLNAITYLGIDAAAEWNLSDGVAREILDRARSKRWPNAAGQ